MKKKINRNYEVTKLSLIFLLAFLIAILFLMISYSSGVSLSPNDFGYKLGIGLMVSFVIG